MKTNRRFFLLSLGTGLAASLAAPPALLAASPQEVADLEETLLNGLKVRAEPDKEFIARVVQAVAKGQLSEGLVKAVFQRARAQHARYPFPYFAVMIKKVAEDRGVDL